MPRKQRSYLSLQHRKGKRYYLILSCQGDDHWLSGGRIAHKPLTGEIHFDVKKGYMDVKLDLSKKNGRYRRRYRLDLSRYL